MTFGVRGRLFLIALLATIAAGLPAVLWIGQELRRSALARVERELTREAEMARRWVESAPGEPSVELYDSLADEIARVTGVGVTLVREDGRVGGDSTLSPAAVHDAGNQGGHAEIRDAVSAGRGVARRYTEAVRGEVLYVAVPFRSPGERGVVRLGVPLRAVDESVAGLRRKIWVIGLLGLGMAAVAAAAAARLLERTWRSALARPLALAHGAPLPPAGEENDPLHRAAGELEEASQRLLAERDRLEQVLGSMQEMVLVVDADRRIVFANRAAHEVLRSSGPPEGRRLFEVLRAAALQEAFEQDLEQPIAVDITVPAQPGRRLLARVTPLGGGAGRVIVLQDVSEVRRLESVRRDFVANVSHELRTPVSVILANSETLLDGALNDRERAERFLAAIHANAERLTRLIADLLDLSRIEAGRYPLDLRAVDTDRAIERAVDAVAPHATSKRQSIRLEATGAPAVHADPKALDQVLLNLLDNAVKYTHDGGHVVVTARAAEDAVRLEVRDDGPGIEPRHRERIFERFYRVDPGRSRSMGGTGLGLSIVRHLVDAMGGRVGLEHVEPQGSLFWFTLPRAPEAAGHAGFEEPDEPPADAAGGRAAGSGVGG